MSAISMPLLSSLAPCTGCPSAGHNQHSCVRTFVSWLARCPVVLGGSCPYPSQCFLEEQALWGWDSFLFFLWDPFLMLLSAFQTSHSFSLRYLSILWKMWSRLLYAFLPPASSLASPILLKSRSIARLGVWGPTGTGLAVGFWSHFFPFPHKHPLTWPCSSPWAIDGNRLIHHSHLLAIAYMAFFVQMPSTVSTNSVDALLFFNTHLR